jgi:hypothetical protein
MCYIDIADVMYELITQFSIIGNNKYKNSFNHSKSSVKWEARSAETSKRFCSLPPNVLATVLAISQHTGQ